MPKFNRHSSGVANRPKRIATRLSKRDTELQETP